MLLVFVAAHFRDVQNRLPEFQRFFGWPNLLFLWLTLAAIKVVHELGHGFACKHFGRECHSIGVMLLVFSPTMYCDVTDAWMLRSKWERILVSAPPGCTSRPSSRRRRSSCGGTPSRGCCTFSASTRSSSPPSRR